MFDQSLSNLSGFWKSELSGYCTSVATLWRKEEYHLVFVTFTPSSYPYLNLAEKYSGVHLKWSQ